MKKTARTWRRTDSGTLSESARDSDLVQVSLTTPAGCELPIAEWLPVDVLETAGWVLDTEGNDAT